MSRAVAVSFPKSEPKSSSRRAAAVPWLLLLPFLAFFALLTVYPLARSATLALRQTWGPNVSTYVGPDNFLAMAGDSVFAVAAGNTLVFACASLVLQIPLALGLAMLLNRPGLRGKALYRLVFFSPQLFGLVFVAILSSLIFAKQAGLLNRGLHAAFGTSLDFPWLQEHVMATLVLASLWLWTGFNMVFFLAALQNIDRSLIDASMVDGAGPWARFRAVVLPAILPVGSLLALLTVIGSLQLFELPYLMLNQTGGPDNRGMTVVMHLYQTGFDTGDLGYASAIGWVLALTMIVAVVVQRLATSRSEA